MSGEAYELLALLMRYVFVLIGALILWRAYRWLRRDARSYRREMRALPDAGLVGEIVDLKTGESQPLPREGIMGSARDCDIRVRGAGVRRRHALFAFEEGKGLRVTPQGRGSVLMAGVEPSGPAHALHGTQLQLGDALLRVRLFAGLKVPHPAQFQEEAAFEEQADAPWADNGSVPPPFAAVDVAEEDEPIQDGREAYMGNYTEDGQMTWQYAAYPLEALRRAQEELDPAALPETEEALPYESPIPKRKRRSRR